MQYSSCRLCRMYTNTLRSILREHAVCEKLVECVCCVVFPHLFESMRMLLPKNAVPERVLQVVRVMLGMNVRQLADTLRSVGGKIALIFAHDDACISMRSALQRTLARRKSVCRVRVAVRMIKHVSNDAEIGFISGVFTCSQDSYG